VGIFVPQGGQFQGVPFFGGLADRGYRFSHSYSPCARLKEDCYEFTTNSFGEQTAEAKVEAKLAQTAGRIYNGPIATNGDGATFINREGRVVIGLIQIESGERFESRVHTS
jgi:hypothetical protein